jgi:hypothetical protein
MQMAISMKGDGWMIKLMEVAHIFIQMEPNMMEIGRMINSMAMELNHGLMVLDMKDIMKMEKNMDRELCIL